MWLGFKGVTQQAFVKEVWFEGVPAREVWFEGVKLYPDARTTVKDIVISSTEDAYWRHAVDAAQRGIALLEASIGEDKFHLFRGDGTLPVLRYAGGSFVADESSGLHLQQCLGQHMQVKASVPRRASAQYCDVSGALLELPYLTGTELLVSWYKPKKRDHAGCWFSVAGDTGVVHYQGGCHTSMHDRGRYERHLPYNDHKWQDKIYNNSMPAGETELRITAINYSHTTKYPCVQLFFPAFNGVWSFDILGVTLH